MSSEFSDSTFGIGAVSRLTGIPMDTLRVWERRYRAVVPRRSSQNRRFYSRDDVARLLLIKQLVEQGEPVSSIVHLQEPDLRQRLRAHAEFNQHSRVPGAAGQDDGQRAVSALIFGEALPYQVNQWAASLPCLRILGGYGVWADFERAALSARPDLLLMEYPALQAEAVTRVGALLRQSGCRRTIVVYAFATESALERLHKQGVQTLRAPVTPASLREVCQIETPEPPTGVTFAAGPANIAPRRYSGKQLAAIAQLNTGLQCECPRHLVDLVSRVSAFEAYSADCENRHEQDAIVHARLYAMTAQARSILEEALTFLLASEGVESPALPGDATTVPLNDEPLQPPALT